MIFADEIPELTEHGHGFHGHWVRAIFMNVLDASHSTKGLLSNYVRTVEAAHARYRDGREKALIFFRSDGSSVPLGALLASCSSFEDCVGHAHYAIQCMIRIRGIRTSPDLAGLFPTKPGFVKGQVQDRVRAMRNAIQHNYQSLFDGKIAADAAFMLGIEGRTDDVSGQERKTWDRLQIDTQHIRFDELHGWLVEMGDCAARIAQYEPA